MTSPRVLVFCDDLYHPAATVREGLAGLSAEFDFEWVEDARGWDPGDLRRFSMALLAKSNVVAHGDKTPWLTGERCEIFDRFVRAGGGLLAVHSGIASYGDVKLVREVLGGTFIGHPPPCAVTVEIALEHEITRSVSSGFAVHDEHYEVQLDDEKAEVFLRSRSLHGVQPAGWTRRHGKGRVCVLTPGHYADVWQHRSYQQMLRRALAWVGASAVPENPEIG